MGNFIIGNFNTPFSEVDRTTRQNIKDIEYLNHTVYNLELIDIYRILYRIYNNFRMHTT